MARGTNSATAGALFRLGRNGVKPPSNDDYGWTTPDEARGYTPKAPPPSDPYGRPTTGTGFGRAPYQSTIDPAGRPTTGSGFGRAPYQSQLDPAGRPTTGSGFGRAPFGNDVPSKYQDVLGRPVEGVGFGRGNAQDYNVFNYVPPTSSTSADSTGLGAIFGAGAGTSGVSPTAPSRTPSADMTGLGAVLGIDPSVFTTSSGANSGASQTAGGLPAGVGGSPAAAPAAPPVNPVDAIYERLLATLDANTADGVSRYEDLIGRIGGAYGDAIGGLQGRMNERNSFYENQLQGLAERVAAQQQLGAQNMANARNVVQNAVNPYTAMQPTQSMSAGNPLAEYLRATGVDPTQSQSLVDLEAANNRNYDAAVANSLATLGAGYQQANDSRLADLALMEAGFASDLAGQENAIRAGLQSQQSAESQAIQDAITNMTLTQLGQEYGLTGDLLGFQNSQGSAIADAMLGQATAGQSFQQNQDNLQANRDNNSVNLLNNILSAYGGDLDPTSVVELVTTFANALGVPAAQVLGGAA